MSECNNYEYENILLLNSDIDRPFSLSVVARGTHESDGRL